MRRARIIDQRNRNDQKIGPGKSEQQSHMYYGDFLFRDDGFAARGARAIASASTASGTDGDAPLLLAATRGRQIAVIVAAISFA